MASAVAGSSTMSPVTRCSSEWHRPDAASSTSTSPALGGSSSISSTLHLLWVSHRMAALLFMTTLLRGPRQCSGQDLASLGDGDPQSEQLRASRWI